MGHLICALYRFFSNTTVVFICTLVIPIVLSVFLAAKNYSVFWILSGVYVIIIIPMIAWAQNYLLQKGKDASIFQEALSGLKTIFYTYSKELVKTATQIKSSETISKQHIRKILSISDFQTVSFYVCRKLCEALTKNVSTNDVCVTVFQRDKTTCRMIAYSDDSEPNNYNTRYNIPLLNSQGGEKAEHHSVIFARNQKNPSFLENQKAVGREFIPHEGCEERESKIQQYIGVPIPAESLGVVFLLQIDTTIEGFFGETKESMEEFYNNTIKPFALFLQMIYEKERVIDQIVRGGFLNG